MKLPEGVTEAQFLAAVEKALDIAVKKAKSVPGYDADDLRQFGYIHAIEAVDKFDPTRGTLEKFLYRHVSNRLKNLFRDTVFRPDSPCRICAMGLGTCPKGNPCETHKQYLIRNTNKASINSPQPIVSHSNSKKGEFDTEISEAAGPDTTTITVEAAELEREIDEHLPVEIRETYLRMRAGLYVTKRDRLEVQSYVREILEAEGIEIGTRVLKGTRESWSQTKQPEPDRSEDAPLSC